MEVRRAFDRSADAVREARRFVTAALVEAEVPHGSVLDLAQLAVSELATNAVQHAGTRFEVAVGVDSCVRIAVHDGSYDAPELRSVVELDDNGRGLALIDAIADRWGCEPNGAGKWVWCELPL